MKTFFSFYCLLFTVMSFGQNGTIKGTIVDSGMNDEPILFANVRVKGLEQRVETNFHGNFEIKNLKSGIHTLVISYLGYETIEVLAVVDENKITQVNGGLTALSFSWADLEISDELTDKTEIEEVPLPGERPKR